MVRKTRFFGKRFGLFLLSVCLTWGIGQIKLDLHGGELAAVYAQTPRPEQAAVVIYEELPYLPQENQYISVETGEIDSDHTLMNRFVRYHRDVKKRSPMSSLDWKVTLADYLGINQSIRASSYPGNSTLTSNPLEKDIEAIRQLNRRQRQELVDLLVKLYTPPSQETANPSQPTEETETTNPSTPSTPDLSEPGDAQLLIP